MEMGGHSEIIDALRAHLTGDWETDIAYLRTEMVKYVNEPEILRAVGRLIFEIMPSELRNGYEEAARGDEASLQEALSDVAEHMQAGRLDDAERALLKILPSEGLYESDDTTDYFSFRNPIELEYFRRKHKHGKSIRVPRFPFDHVYQVYAFILVEQRRFDEALRIIETAQKRNPLFAEIGFEKAELYKLTGDAERSLSCTLECSGLVYMPPEIARYYRNVGDCFVERSMWEEAVASYSASRLWEESPVADRELEFIVRKAGRPIDLKRCAENWKEILGRRSIPLPPDPLWAEVARRFAEDAFGSADYYAAQFGYAVVHALTGDKEAGGRIEECRRRLEKG